MFQILMSKPYLHYLGLFLWSCPPDVHQLNQTLCRLVEVHLPWYNHYHLCQKRWKQLLYFPLSPAYSCEVLLQWIHRSRLFHCCRYRPVRVTTVVFVINHSCCNIMHISSKTRKEVVITASIKDLISDSINSDPTFFKPSLSSWYVIVPLLSVSIILNNSFRPPISSSESRSAMTCKRIFFLCVSPHCKRRTWNIGKKGQRFQACLCKHIKNRRMTYTQRHLFKFVHRRELLQAW